MAHLAVCVAVWTLVFLLIPFGRIKALWPAVILSFLWMLFVDNIMASLGYYSFEKNWVPFGSVSFFQLLAYGGVGILMVNWLRENPMSKLVSMLTVAMLLSLLCYFYALAGAFRLGSFDAVSHFIYCVAALAVYLWLALAVIGEENISRGPRTRRFLKSAS